MGLVTAKNTLGNFEACLWQYRKFKERMDREERRVLSGVRERMVSELRNFSTLSPSQKIKLERGPGLLR